MFFCTESVGFVGLMLSEYDRLYKPGDLFQDVAMREIKPFVGINANPQVKYDLMCVIGRVLICSYVYNAVHGNTMILNFQIGESVLTVSPSQNEKNTLTVEIKKARDELNCNIN